MNTAKIYQDQDGNECSIHQMVKREPEWAASRIQAGEDALAMVAKIKEWDIQRFMETGKYILPLELRDQIQRLSR